MSETKSPVARKRKPGRPRKQTEARPYVRYGPEVLDTVREVIDGGGKFRDCYKALGIGHGTWWKWRQRYPEFKALVVEMRERIEDMKEVMALDPDVHETILSICTEGGSFKKCMVELGISLGTWHRWQEKYDEFKEIVEEGRNRSQVWWEDKGQANMFDKAFPGQTYSFVLANRFPADYTIRHQVDVKTDVNVTLLDEVRTRNAALRAQRIEQSDRLRLVSSQDVIEGEVVTREDGDAGSTEHG